MAYLMTPIEDKGHCLTKSINKLLYFCEYHGIRVYMNHSLTSDGRIIYTRKIIQINAWRSITMLCVIAHEIGHWIHYMRRGGKSETNLQPNVAIREQKAHLYGWFILKLLEIPITKEFWRYQDLDQSLDHLTNQR